MHNTEIDSQMKEDFALFMHLVWDCMGYTPHPIQSRTARWIQNAKPRRGLFAMRNFGKTLLIATLVCWQLKRDPNAGIAVQSGTEKHAKKIVGLVKQLIEASPYLAELRRQSPDQMWGRLMLNVGGKTRPDLDPSLQAVGLKGQITGSHVDHIISDDLETPENSRTVEARDLITDKILEYEDIVNPGGTVTLIGTFQTVEAVLVDSVKNMGYEGIRVPAEYPNPDEDDGSGIGCMWILAPWLKEDLEEGRAKAGEATYPERWPLDRLLEYKAQSPSRYQLQRMLDPTLSDENRFPLKLRDLIVHTVNPEMGPRRIMWANEKALQGFASVGIGNDRYYEHGHVGDDWADYQQRIMWVDPAGVQESSDEVGVTVAYMLNGLIRVPVMTGLEGGHNDSTLKKIAAMADKHRVTTIWVEPDMGDGMFTKILSGMVNSKLGLSIAVKNAEKAAKRGSKEPWICDTLEPIISNHRLVLDPSVLRDEESMYQLSHVTRDRGCLRHDDRIDSLAGACSLFQSAMFKDMDVAERERKLEIRKAELAEWDREIREQTGVRKARRSWISR